MAPTLLALAIACSGPRPYVVEGTVLEVHPPDEVLLDHEAIEGLMGPMIMPFSVRDPALLAELAPGDRITARYLVGDDGSHLARIRVTARGPLPGGAAPSGPAPLGPGEQLPGVKVATTAGELTLGNGQAGPVALTFVYTRCPLPEFCPAVVARLQALQPEIEPPARIVVVTLDPGHDDLRVLGEFGALAGADPARWAFGRVEEPVLADLAMRAGLRVERPEPEDGAAATEIAHSLRLLVLDRDGRLVERYDDARWPLERVAEQLRGR